MAEEGENKQPDWMTPLGVLLFLALISRAITSIPETLEERYGIDIYNLGASYENVTTLAEGTPLGTKVITTASANVFSQPSARGVLRGLQAVGAVGELVDGPILRDSGRWWAVDFEGGADGWVAEVNLENHSLFSLIDTFVVSGMVLSALISVVFAVIVTYLIIRISQLRAAARQAYLATIPQEHERRRNTRWEAVESLVTSDRPSDWRQAIIEADTMLDELVTRMDYRGDSLGEKLKQIQRGDFYTIEQAWEAHKVRNRIAHEGSDYILTQREARRVINLYRQVFDEFEVV